MKISPARFNYCNLKRTNNVQSFGSICADANAETQDDYAKYTIEHRNDFGRIKTSSTRIFRELPSELAIARMLNPEQKSQIKVLGCSDGSEAWAYAIAIKEVMGKNTKNVSIQAVDYAPYMINTAKTGCLVLSDIERKYAEGETAAFEEKSPIAGKGWNQYLTKTKRPKEFNQIIQQYPFMKYIESDPVVNKKIGSGLDWYEINKQGLPNVTFEHGNMLDYLDSDEDAKNVVYVVANSARYVFEKNPSDFVKIFCDIKKKNEGKNKNVYVAMGSLETEALNNIVWLKGGGFITLGILISLLGFKNIPETELARLGIISKSSTSKKLYRLEA